MLHRQSNRRNSPGFLPWLAALLVCLLAAVATSQELRLPAMESSPARAGASGNHGFPLPFGFAPKTFGESDVELDGSSADESVATGPLAAQDVATTLPASPTDTNFAPVVTASAIQDAAAFPIEPPTETLVAPVTHEQSIGILGEAETSAISQTVQSQSTDSHRTPIVSRQDRQASYASNGSPTSRSLVTTFGGLCIVLGLLMGFVWLVKRNGAMQPGPQHAPLVEVLGSYRIGPRNEVSVVRFGSKLLAVSVSANGTETLAELDDPQEVSHLIELCGSTNPATVPWRLRQAIDNLAADSHSPRSTFNS